MSVLLDARTALATALETDAWWTHVTPPESIDPPCVIVQPADNYLQADEEAITYGDRDTWLVTVDLWVIAAETSSEEAVDQLDVMQEHVITHLPDGWWVSGTGQPDVVMTGDWRAYGNRITVQTQLTIQKETTP